MKFVLATHNPGKLKEMADILSGLGVEVVSPADVGISVDCLLYTSDAADEL